MIIYINGRFLSHSITGVQRYAFEIVRSLDEFLSEYSSKIPLNFILIAPKNIKHSILLKNIKYIEKGKTTGNLWEQIELPILTANGFLLNLCNTAPILKKNQTVTIHDVSVYACPDGFSVFFRIWYKILYFILGKRLQHIFTVSKFSAEEIQKYCSISQEKIQVNYLGIDHVLRTEEMETILEKYEIPEKRFVLAVSSLNRNKNFQMVIETAKMKKDIFFVIAGGFNRKIFSNNQLQFPSNVKYIGYITDEELVGLYKKAGCFLYPSLYEGFGLPPLEAMACECPVIVSNCASLPEICKDGALYCNPYDAKDIAERIDEILLNHEIRKKCILQGKKVVEKYKWNITAEKLLLFLKNL